MSITILAVAVAILATFFAMYRLVDRVLLVDEQPMLVDTEETLSELDELAQRRAMLMRELKDIELDYDTGKISDEDFSRLSRRYRREWLKIDKQLDEVAGLEAQYLEEVEVELQKRLAAESLDGSRRPRSDRAICPECGAANPVRLTACRECGSSLDVGVQAPLRAAKAT